jgi:hypothetical protein
MRFSALPALFFAALTVAAPVDSILEERQAATYCGSTYYSASQVRAATNQGVNYYYNGQQVGSGSYPYVFFLQRRFQTYGG